MLHRIGVRPSFGCDSTVATFTCGKAFGVDGRRNSPFRAAGCGGGITQTRGQDPRRGAPAATSISCTLLVGLPKNRVTWSSTFVVVFGAMTA